MIVSNVKAGRQAVPNEAGEFEMWEYTEAMPQMPQSPSQNVVVIPRTQPGAGL